MNIEQLNSLVDETVTTDLSPYKVAQSASVVVGTYVREQMVYQYVSKRMIPSYVKDGRKFVKRDDARTWIKKYATKKLGVETTEVVDETV